ncbi:MAG: hypothetical protein ACOC53_05380 [Candidatus Saliniplasma sp.]
MRKDMSFIAVNLLVVSLLMMSVLTGFFKMEDKKNKKESKQSNQNEDICPVCGHHSKSGAVHIGCALFSLCEINEEQAKKVNKKQESEEVLYI